MDQFPPPNILVYSTEELIGLSPEHVVKCCQSFTQVIFCYGLKVQYLNQNTKNTFLLWRYTQSLFQMWRGKIHPSSRDLSNACQKLLSSIYFKLRRLRPYIICSLDFKADFNEDNELQLSVYGELNLFIYQQNQNEDIQSNSF